jgi:serine/threonine protein kinase
VQIAGFGLQTMMEACGSRQDSQPQGYLFSTNGTFMGMPAYISPERVQGQPIDTRSDIYTLGIILFELLTGSLPFRGEHPLDIALKRLQQPVPSLYAAYPDIPEALDLVIGKTLDLDPARRYQRAGDIAAAFERVLQLLEQVEKTSTPRSGQFRHEGQKTLPPTLNWFNEAENPSEKRQSMPPLVTGSMPAVPAGHSDSMAGFDPFAWWSATSASSKMPASRKPPARTTVRLKSNNSRSRSQALHEDRRRLVGFIVAGTVTAGVFGVGGISFAHFVSSLKQSQSQVASLPTTGSTPTTSIQGNTPTTAPTQGPHKTPAPSKSPTPKASPSATKSPQPSPTAQPTKPPAPTPTPPSHTGKVIGNTNQPKNSAQNFTNPADGHGSLLIHLGNGNFVACETACTHEGVPVNYDPNQGKLVCPAHQAVFDPNNGFNQVPGPGPSGLGPLPRVNIRANPDGTITTG